MSHVDEGTLHAYLDGALPPAERSQVDAHLASCPECRERLAEARALIARADALLALALPAERAAPPLHELRRRPLWWRVRWPIAWAASITLAVGLGWMLRGREARQEFAAFAERDTVPQAVATLQRSTDEPRPMAQPHAPASRSGPLHEQGQGAAERARADSLIPSTNAASGVVPILTPSNATSDRPPAVRAAAPAPAVSITVDGMVATGAARVMERARAEPVMSSTWPVIQRGSASRMLGTEPATIPGVPVKDMRMSPYADGVVLVEQVIDSTLVIQLFQRRADAAAADSAAARGYQFQRQRAAERERVERVERLARFVGPLRVEIAGPLGTDSLSKLLELVK